MKFHLKLAVLALLLPLFSCLKSDDPVEFLPTSPAPAQQSNAVVWSWTELYLEIEKDLDGFRPAPTSRALGYIHMGAYETVVPGMPQYVSLETVIDGYEAPTLRYRTDQIDWRIALNAYYARTFRFFLFNANDQHHFDINALESTQLNALSLDVPLGIVNTSVEWGQQVANTIIAYSETDREGALQSRIPRPTDYTPPQGTGLWIPTFPDLSRALFPYWGKTRSFANFGADLVCLPPPYEYSTEPASDYYKDNLEVADAVSNLTNEAHWIAEFWSDDLTGLTFSPPARIFAITNQVIQLKKLNLEETVHLYCKLGMAINDAAVAAWNSKYIYNTERPETYILGHIDPDFKSILGQAIGTTGLNPSFPGYPSGHSTFAGVSWAVLEHFFGPNTEFTDNCHFGRTEFRGYPRSYTSWQQMAEENAFSRIPLGVHVRMDCTEGLRLGRAVSPNGYWPWS